LVTQLAQPIEVHQDEQGHRENDYLLQEAHLPGTLDHLPLDVGMLFLHGCQLLSDVAREFVQ
jgi:hypothetical protein